MLRFVELQIDVFRPLKNFYNKKKKTFLFALQEQLMDVYERLEDMAADTAEARAAHILHGLGFTAKMQKTPTKDFSGGWRMRIALARYATTSKICER